MRRKSTWLVLALMVVSLVFALAGCGGDEETTETEYTLSETEITLTVEETKKLTISPAPEAAVTWSSDATAVATVEGGTVTAVKEGTANITAAIAGVEEPLTCKVTVKAKQGGGDITETTYKLETSSISIKTTETFQLKVLDEEGKEVTTGVTYTSEDPAVATVSATGLVTGVAVGSTSVKATVGGETLTATVTVAQKYTFTLTPDTLDIAAGAKAQLTLTSTPARPEGARPHTFTSSNPAVATVNGGSGEVTGVAKGTATITCSVEGEEVTATVTVTEYTVKIGDAVMTENTALRVGEADKQITVTADPSSHAVEATYASSNEQAVTITEDHKIHAVAAGESDVTVSVGGRTFTTHVTVSSLVQYTLKAGEDEVDEETPLTLVIGDSKELSVVRDPAGEVTFTIEISGTQGVLTSAQNTITAAKVGTATVKVTVTDANAASDEPIEFTFTVNVSLHTTLATEDFVFGEKAIDLTYLDANKTLDWYKYWFNDRGQNKVRMKNNNANLIGDYVMASGVDDEEFWDYPVPVLYEDADAEKAFSGNTYGRAVHGSYSIEVKLTTAVTKIILLTGAWKETSVIEFKIGDIVLQSNKIEASTEGDNPPSTARGLTLTINPAEIPAEGLTLTISVNCNRAHGGNASIVAAAVIGNTPHDHTPTAETEMTVQKGVPGEVNLTEVGNLDWVAVKEGGVYRKAGVPENTVIKANEITYRDPDAGTFGNDFGKDEGNKAYFTWTDGTEAAPAAMKNFMWANDYASIPVALTEGDFTVSLYTTGWSSAYMVAVYDANGTFIEGKQVTPTTNQGVTAKVTIKLNVKAAGDYTFKVIKLRDSNCGWAAIAVSQKSDYSLAESNFDLTLGGTAPGSIVVKKGEDTVSEGITYASSAPGVVTVGENGQITVVGKGTATITVTVGGVKLYANVTVTEYTVKIGDAAITGNLSMRVGDGDLAITVTADPAHAIEATYHSSNEQFVTITEDHKIHAVAAGESDITITVGGKTFTTHVTVAPRGQYSLQAGGEDIADNTVTMKLGGTLQLSILTEPTGITVPTTTYESQSATVAQVGDDGLITAKGVGTTTVTVKITGADTFTITVNVIYDVKLTEVDYLGEASVNLDALGETNVTLDWRYYGKENYTDRKKGGNLIGDFEAEKASDFFDYRVKMSWIDGTTTARSLDGRIDGITFKTNVSFTVKATKDVKYIAVFTGAWHATNTISISYNDMVCASKAFTNTGADGEKNKQIIFTPDQTHFVGTEMTFTVTIEFEGDGNQDNNISLVAVAVIGNAQRTASATAETPAVTALTNETRNLSLIGTEDWVYAKNGNGNLVRRSGVENVIKDDEIQYTGGDGTDRLQEAFGGFNWYEQDSSEAPEGGSVNNTHWANGTWLVPIHLTAGKHVVTLYLTGWKASYFVTVLDGNANTIVEAAKVVTGSGDTSVNGGNQAVAVKITIDVTKEDTFTFLMTRSGDGNHGWAAIAVGYETDLTLEETEFDLTVGGTAPGKIVVKKGGENYTTDVSFASSASQVVTVDASDGSLTVVGKGRAIITVTCGSVKLRAFVTVTEYTLTSGTEITISVDGTSEIRISADPDHAINAEYAVTAGGESYVDVSEQGTITAKAKGQATVTATVDGKVFTITVNVVEYKLSEESITLTLGDEPATATLKMTEGDEDTDVTGVTFESDDALIASVDETSGLITAKGFGQTKIKAKKDGAVLECTVIVKLKVEITPTDYPEGSNVTVNLDELDDTNATLDWHYFRNDNVHEMADGSLIGDLSRGKSNPFNDYRTHFTWYNGDEKEKASYFGYTDGWTFSSEHEEAGTVSVSFDVKVTKDVKYIALFTGAWHAKNSITISYGDVEYAKFEFSNKGNSGNIDKNKKLVFTPDMAHFGEEEKTFTIKLTVWAEEDNGWKDNVSLVAIAVVGNTPRVKQAAAATATAESTALVPEQENIINISEVGTLDWAYICDGDNGMVRKDGGNNIISDIYTVGKLGNGKDGFGNKNQFFTWTGGTKEPSGGTKTNNAKWCDGAESIAVTLTQSAEVTLYISDYQSKITLYVYDAHGNRVLEGYEALANNNGDNGGSVKVKLNVTEAGTFTFFMAKEGNNFGLAAIAVANAAE